jgi:uncharacterized protein (TIGR02588 family)
LVGSAAIVLLVVVLILVQIPGEDDPAAPAARVEEVRKVGDVFHVEVGVHNAGESTAAQVQVTADLTLEGTTHTGEQVIDFLSGGEEKQVVFIFDEDPASGDLRATVTGCAVP